MTDLTPEQEALRSAGYDFKTGERLFDGYALRDCGEHRTVGSHRAWCFDCSEWCYSRSQDMACKGCEVAWLRIKGEPTPIHDSIHLPWDKEKSIAFRKAWDARVVDQEGTG
jgi:hypothetical protein